MSRLSKNRKTVLGMMMCAASSVCGFAQSAETKVLPLPLVSPRVVNSTVTAPGALTPAEKAQLAIKNTFGPRAIANRLLLAGINQWQNHPEEWPGGMEGYGMRFGNRMGRLAIRNAVRLGTDVAFRLDPRYDRCDCSGFLSRTRHAWKRVIVSRTDSGGQAFAVSNFAGAYVPPMLTDQWYPDRLNTWQHKFESGTWNLGWRGATNMLREFWPEVKRGFRRGGRDN